MNRYFGEISREELLTAEEEVSLGRRIRNGDEGARQKLIERNLRLVVVLAKPYRRFGLDLEDLVAEGNVGLIQAVERFDPEMGCRFSTYAAWWIKQFVRKALVDQSRTIRVPVHVLSKLRSVRKLEQQLAADLGRKPSAEEMKEITGMTSER
ncbi:MAG: sigma-70 family RNA polymerase sigma factor, partial [Verrucomicrobiota bacterium]